MAGPFIKGIKCDIIWVEVDKMYYLVPRYPNVPLEVHLNNLTDIAHGRAMTMAGCNATGYKDLEELIDGYVDRQISEYKEFINNLNKK